MDISKMIKRLLLERDSTAADLAGRLDTSRANISQRLKRNTWTVADLEQIAAAYGCGVVVGFVLPDGQTIMQTVPTGSIPAGPAVEIRQPPETCPPSPSPAPAAEQPRRKAPAAEQPAQKSTEQPKRPTLEELLEQRKAKLAEQVAEIQRKEEARAAEEAKKEAERQKLIEEGREILRQFVIQFNREQARLAGEGKKFKEWDDLYEQDQCDILHAAAFRDYREVFALQELTPRERKARGFPLFDEKPKNP